MKRPPERILLYQRCIEISPATHHHQRHALSLKSPKNCIICQGRSCTAVRMTAPWLIWKACSKTAAHYKCSSSGFLWQEAAGSLGVTEGRVSHYEPRLVTTALCETTINWNEFIFTDRLKRGTWVSKTVCGLWKSRRCADGCLKNVFWRGPAVDRQPHNGMLNPHNNPLLSLRNPFVLTVCRRPLIYGVCLKEICEEEKSPFCDPSQKQDQHFVVTWFGITVHSRAVFTNIIVSRKKNLYIFFEGNVYLRDLFRR